MRYGSGLRHCEMVLLTAQFNMVYSVIAGYAGRSAKPKLGVSGRNRRLTIFHNFGGRDGVYSTPEWIQSSA